MPTHYLLVEGEDDKVVLDNLIKKCGRTEFYRIEVRQGIDSLLGGFKATVLSSDADSVGVVLDADSSPQNRWQSIIHKAEQAGYGPVPRQPDPKGTVLTTPGKPSLGFWLMPDNQNPGMLEDFLAHLLPTADVLWPYAEECVKKLPKQLFIDAHIAKAKIHTWLAWQGQPGTRPGAAITQQVLDTNNPAAQTFLAWLDRLWQTP